MTPEIESGGLMFVEALNRAKAEFIEMPGLQITSGQAVKLWGYEQALCDAVLSALVEARFLIRIRDVFARV